MNNMNHIMNYSMYGSYSHSLLVEIFSYTLLCMIHQNLSVQLLIELYSYLLVRWINTWLIIIFLSKSNLMIYFLMKCVFNPYFTQKNVSIKNIILDYFEPIAFIQFITALLLEVLCFLLFLALALIDFWYISQLSRLIKKYVILLHHLSPNFITENPEILIFSYSLTRRVKDLKSSLLKFRLIIPNSPFYVLENFHDWSY
jgi:hypothetical protein